MNTSFNVEEFEATIVKALEDFKKLIASFPVISNTYKDLSELTKSDDNNGIWQKMQKMSDTTNTLYAKCEEIESRMSDWIIRYKNAVMQSDEELLATCKKISQNLASYNQELSSLM